MLLGRREPVRAHDLLARIIAVAEAPGRRARRIVADQRHLVRAPDLLEADGRVAAVIARIEPEVAVLVEVRRREDVVRQRLDAGRNGAVLRREDRRVAFGNAGADEQAFALGADDEGGLDRIARAAADARLRAGAAAATGRRPRNRARPSRALPTSVMRPPNPRGARSFTARPGACLQPPRGLETGNESGLTFRPFTRTAQPVRRHHEERSEFVNEESAPVRHRGAARNGGSTTGNRGNGSLRRDAARRRHVHGDDGEHDAGRRQPAHADPRMAGGRCARRGRRDARGRRRRGDAARQAADGRLRLAERQPRRLLREVRAPRAAARRQRAHHARHGQAASAATTSRAGPWRARRRRATRPTPSSSST